MFFLPFSFEFLRLKIQLWDYTCFITLLLPPIISDHWGLPFCNLLKSGASHPLCKSTYFLTDMKKKKKSQNSAYSLAAKPSTELALVALAFPLRDVDCTSGTPGKLPLGGIQASTREAAWYTGRSLRCGVRWCGLKSSAIHQEIQCYPSRAPVSEPSCHLYRT